MWQRSKPPCLLRYKENSVRKLIYHVAVTVDGFIARKNGSVDGFLMQGDHVDAYLEHLKEYDTVVMGRRTYETGYDFGLRPGDIAYPNMKHFVVSKTLSFAQRHADLNIVGENAIEVIRSLKDTQGTSIYLCGGGSLAGSLLRSGMIDELLLKVNPVAFGEGIRLFEGIDTAVGLTPLNTTSYESGVVLNRYSIAIEKDPPVPGSDFR